MRLHIVRRDGELAVAAVDQNGELDAACAAEAGDRLDRGAHGAPGVEYVVHENDGRALDARVGGGHRRVLPRHVVAPRRHVQLDDRRSRAFDLTELVRDALREVNAACADAGEQEMLGALVFFDDLERDAGQRTADAVRVHDHGFLTCHATLPSRINMQRNE